MIKTLEIKNFQSHKNTLMEFSPGVNVIIGNTDSGKSAIIRAIRFALWNKPGGDSFRSDWGGETKVKVTFDNEVFVIRKKGDVNEYNCDGTKYQAFGANVPEDIVDKIKVNEINLQRQHDKVFLLNETPGTIAAHFNKMAGIDMIDTGTKNVKKEINDVTKTLKIRREDFKEKKNKLSLYDNMEEIEERINSISSLNATKENNEKKIKSLSQKIKQLTEIEHSINEYSSLLQLEDEVDLILSSIKERNELKQEIKYIKNIVTNAININNEIATANKLSKINLNEILADIALRNKLQAEINKLQALISKYTGNSNKLKEWGLKHDELHAKFKANLKICPLCGTKIK